MVIGPGQVWPLALGVAAMGWAWILVYACISGAAYWYWRYPARLAEEPRRFWRILGSQSAMFLCAILTLLWWKP